jgi:hypothetical protein
VFQQEDWLLRQLASIAEAIAARLAGRRVELVSMERLTARVGLDIDLLSRLPLEQIRALIGAEDATRLLAAGLMLATRAVELAALDEEQAAWQAGRARQLLSGLMDDPGLSETDLDALRQTVEALQPLTSQPLTNQPLTN